MSSLDLTSTVGATSPKALDRSEASTKGGGAHESFGRLFGRVFGQAPMRQSFAGSESSAQEPQIRTVLLGSNTQVITAGDPPTEEEILAFAREANLDETSLKALLLTASGLGELKSDRGADTTGGDFSANASHGLEANQILGIDGVSASDLLNDEALSGPSGVLPLQTATNSAGLMTSTDFLSKASQAVSGGLSLVLGDAVAALNSSAANTSQPAGSDTFRITLEPLAAGSLDSELASKDVLASRSLTGQLYSEEAANNKLAARLGLGLKGLSDSISVDDLLRRIQEKKSLGVQDPIKLQLADASKGLDLWALDASLESGADSGNESRLYSALGSGTALESSLRSGSGSFGDGGNQSRHDSQGGKPMSQQVMQRFGDILGQRLIQQINQGDWKVEIALEPGDLGSIQIELEWRKGELEASFKAGQALTRDLLQDGLPRLRETLERSGIDVASVYVGDQGRQQTFSGGARHSGSNDLKQSQSSDQGNGLEVQATGPQGKRIDDGRLDVLV
jgi:flagellar hook-length control protein FliK